MVKNWLILLKLNSTMKNLFPLLIFLCSISVSAQTKVTATVNITAEVSQSIELITVNSMTLENAQPGQTIININPINDLNSGHMIAQGSPGGEFRLDYDLEKRLDRVEGPGYLTFTYALSGNTVENQSTSQTIQYQNRNLQFNKDGSFYIWLGGILNLENAQPGSYEGDFTIEIEYI